MRISVVPAPGRPQLLLGPARGKGRIDPNAEMPYRMPETQLLALCGRAVARTMAAQALAAIARSAFSPEAPPAQPGETTYPLVRSAMAEVLRHYCQAGLPQFCFGVTGDDGQCTILHAFMDSSVLLSTVSASELRQHAHGPWIEDPLRQVERNAVFRFLPLVFRLPKTAAFSGDATPRLLSVTAHPSNGTFARLRIRHDGTDIAFDGYHAADKGVNDLVTALASDLGALSDLFSQRCPVAPVNFDGSDTGTAWRPLWLPCRTFGAAEEDQARAVLGDLGDWLAAATDGEMNLTVRIRTRLVHSHDGPVISARLWDRIDQPTEIGPEEFPGLFEDPETLRRALPWDRLAGLAFGFPGKGRAHSLYAPEIFVSRAASKGSLTAHRRIELNRRFGRPRLEVAA